MENLEQKQETMVRLDNGMIEGIDYPLNSDGSINWRNLIKPEHTVINRQYKDSIEKKLGKPIADISPTELEDKYLLILLQGFKDLAFLRGYTSIYYRTPFCSQSFVSMICQIDWIPNLETKENVIFESCGDASKENTNSWYAKYLTAAAENRAFVRCVRNFLRIPVVGFDEIGPQEESNPEEVNPSDPYVILESMMRSKNVPWTKLKETLIKMNMNGAAEWNSVKEISKSQMFEIIGMLGK